MLKSIDSNLNKSINIQTTAKTIFDLYDEDRDNKLGPKEVGIFLTSIFNNLHYYEGLDDPTPIELEEKLK